MPAEITTLIDKQDAFEKVREKLAEILLVEQANQQVLALAAIPPKDPNSWKLRIFMERSSPWEEWLNPESDDFDKTPMVNIAVDSGTYDARSSNTVERQTSSVTYNIDCYGVGISTETPSGHAPGDVAAARECQRCFRLARNILMAGAYTYLGLRGQVGKRFPQGFEAFQPPIDGQTVQRVQAMRFKLVVDMNELSPQVQGEALETVGVTVLRKETGEVYLSALYEYT